MVLSKVQLSDPGLSWTSRFIPPPPHYAKFTISDEVPFGKDTSHIFMRVNTGRLKKSIQNYGSMGLVQRFNPFPHNDTF